MIEIEQIEVAAEQLRVYDVEQGAWEHEGEGFEANTTHVLLHLVKDTTGKDFSDGEVVQSQIAPDCVQYGLRLVRWTGQDARMALPTRDQANVTRALSTQRRFGSLPLHQIAFMEATAIIAKQLHSRDHDRTRGVAGANNLWAARNSGRLLVYAASLQAEGFEFDLFEAFDQRLASLRTRFGIPEPESA